MLGKADAAGGSTIVTQLLDLRRYTVTKSASESGGDATWGGRGD